MAIFTGTQPATLAILDTIKVREGLRPLLDQANDDGKVSRQLTFNPKDEFQT